MYKTWQVISTWTFRQSINCIANALVNMLNVVEVTAYCKIKLPYPLIFLRQSFVLSL